MAPSGRAHRTSDSDSEAPSTPVTAEPVTARRPQPRSRPADLLAAFADASDALFDAGIIRSDSFTGEIGEFVAARTLGLALVGRNTAAIDGTRGGRGYQVKSVARDDPRASIPLVRLVAGFDTLVCVRLTLRFAPIEVIEIQGADLPPATRIVTERLLQTIRCRRHLRFPASVLAALPLLDRFGLAYEALVTNEVIGTRNVVGDVGARYAAEILGLTLIDDPTNAGYDAVDADGGTYRSRRDGCTRAVGGRARRDASTTSSARPPGRSWSSASITPSAVAGSGRCPCATS